MTVTLPPINLVAYLRRMFRSLCLCFWEVSNIRRICRRRPAGPYMHDQRPSATSRHHVNIRVTLS